MHFVRGLRKGAPLSQRRAPLPTTNRFDRDKAGATEIGRACEADRPPPAASGFLAFI
ncbi:conserved hypothetical protein [Burkholderia mallei PRL-20]|uniref:Uncharacterized protein n=1 Tax=Burkholderia mallei (strain NCTC 10229) TaxID=412022 RepID=A2RWW5_BURM9|nr:hypothetical protein BMASAVP1_0058 [Burkholderia mallei SAVP1]ABN00214.1 hypothetical protein BMA10229_0360 [Burkholderia mallei NCTC 10229]ABO03872.1 hypothetical protein BMA10247_A1225 [Burkholderia mallei NCTC 10247]EDK55225.1 hypothetical protein BMAFMH_E0224 [Burkholderia mallei FMH]EDK61216.1 hypothetical protein BMAJHU_I0220 [Burkholderia mallei JHU]EDK83958.1 hypothetical protein BMA721280_L0301 [Burkholderia mallei 2002721280]EDP85424.1 hypothetical protein BMA10399_G0436 [Burkhol